MDDGADLVTEILTKRQELAKNVVASMEETTTGIIRLRAMEKDGVLKFPVIAVNDADCKHLFDAPSSRASRPRTSASRPLPGKGSPISGKVSGSRGLPP
jgi:hypothetical protein